METLFKWLNKPKADDKSLLARFFRADRALADVASELDSFDGRSEPDRCSRLVSRLRQGQDKVLTITNLIIEELLGDERDPRAFRVKFPEEVLQENLAGQLWFGAECIAAGSSIMNREQESKEMRPLAEAVTRSLNNVRCLLRDQCLRNNVPNSERLNLDKNDSSTEVLYESLKRFDRLFAEFEWRYVSAMVQVKTKEEYEMQEMICVLCSETLQRALKLGHLEQEKVDAFDPALMFSIPRLAIVTGLVVYPNGPLNMDMPAEQLSEMFRPFRGILIKVRDHLRNLNETELFCLERLLCTNEDISLKDTLLRSKDSAIPDNNQNTQSSKYTESTAPPPPAPNSETIDTNRNDGPMITNTTSKLSHKSCKTFKTKSTRRADSPSPAPSTTSSSSDECSPCTTPISSTPSSPRSTHSLGSTTTAGATSSSESWIDDEEEADLDNDHDNDGDGMASAVASTAHLSTNVDPTDGVLATATQHRRLHDDDAAHYADDDDSDVNDNDQDDDVFVDGEEGKTDAENDHHELYSMMEQIISLEMAMADCATGYLISNTTLGNLLQPQEVPLTDNFIVAESNSATPDDCNENLDTELPTTSARALVSAAQQQNAEPEKLRVENNNNNNVSAASSDNYESLESEHSMSQQSSLNNPSISSATQTRRRRYSDVSQLCSKEHRSQRHHHHRHHHHHHHHHHHQHQHQHHNGHSTTDASPAATTASSPALQAPSSRSKAHSSQSHQHTTAATTTSTSTSSSSRHRLHTHHHHRRPHRHASDRNRHTTTASSTALQCEECLANAAKDDNATSYGMKVHKDAAALGVGIETASSSSSLLDDNKAMIVRSGGRMKFKSTENLLHRLFVCIAGVADQLQTNFAFDLRQILRSVFLMNMSPAEEELDIPEKPKDSELFEFRASENDVIQESAGSSQSIYSAEEVNPEGDSHSQNSNSSSGGGSSSSSSNDSTRAYRHSTGNSSPPTSPASEVVGGPTMLQRQQIERSRSLDNQALPASQTQLQTQPQTQMQSQPHPLQQQQQQHTTQVFRSRYHSTGSNTTPSSLSSSENNSPVYERSSNISSSNRRASETNANSMAPTSASPQTRPTMHLSPPAWIPDQKAPRCMSCNTPFTAFRRRHHCRNCGGVFCGVCSNTSAPLPKYGLTKAVRVCRACFVHELGGNEHAHAPRHHSSHTHRQLVSQATANNEPASHMRRPVTTSRAID